MSVENVIEQEIVGNHGYTVLENIQTTQNFNLKHVKDEIGREFALKTVFFPQPEVYVDILQRAKSKPGLATFFAFYQQNDCVKVLFELGYPIVPISIPKNLIKRRMRQIMTSVLSLYKIGVCFSPLKISDFYETNGSVRLIHYESCFLNEQMLPTTFKPAVGLLLSILDPRRSSLDSTSLKNFERLITNASSTKMPEMASFINSELCRDDFLVTISQRSSRSATPDPRSLYGNVPVKSSFITKSRPDYVQPEPISKYEYLQCSGIIIVLFSCIFINVLLPKRKITWSGIALKTIWIWIAACGAQFFSTINLAKIERKASLKRLKKWTWGLTFMYLLIVFGKLIEIGSDNVSYFSLFIICIWILLSIIVPNSY